MADRFVKLSMEREARAGATSFTADQARALLTKKLATMSSSVRKVFQHANSSFQVSEADGRNTEESGLEQWEFKQFLDKFNIHMTDAECGKLFRSMDPDGSGSITYPEFARQFGDTISGGANWIRWGSTAVPKGHKVSPASACATRRSIAQNRSAPATTYHRARLAILFE